MSQDGSSSRSYIKHPTEKARLDNLAFTSFPEDYLPYTSPSYQRKAPYLVWDDGGSRFRARHRQLCRSCCCCGTVALASAIALLVAAILAIVAVSVYLGVVTNLFRSPILSISGRFRVMDGDYFEDSLLNLTSYEFVTKAEYYRTLVENTFLSSSLEPAFIAARIYAFRPGSLLVFFRVHLDRRKLHQEDPETILMAKNLFIEEAIMAPKPSFDDLILDLPSIDIREYGDEEWLMTYDFDAQPGDTNSLRQQFHTTKTPESTKIISRFSSSVVTHTVTSSKLVPTASSSSKEHETVISTTEQPNRLSPFSSQTPKTPSVVHTSNKGEGSVHYGYAEWKPVELPDPISVSSLGISPQQQEKKDRKTQPGRGSVTTITENLKPPIDYRPLVSNPQKQPSQPSVSSIMSSVSLMILPNSKNKNLTIKENTGVGVVRAVLADEEDSIIVPSSDELEKKGRIDKHPTFSSENKRVDLASFRLLNFNDHEDELSNANEAQPNDQTSMLVEEPDVNENVSLNKSHPGFMKEVTFEAETKIMGTEITNRSFVYEKTQSYDDDDKVLLEDESSTFSATDQEREYTSGNDETEKLSTTYLNSEDITSLFDDFEVNNTFVTDNPLLSWLLTDEAALAEETLVVSSGSGSTTGVFSDESNYKSSISDVTTVNSIELISSVAAASLLNENISEDFIVTTVDNLTETIKTQEISENLDDVVLSSFLEPSNTSHENGETSQNRYLTIVNHSSFPTKYHTLEKNSSSFFENSTSQNSEKYEDTEHETISSDGPDIHILEGSEFSNISAKEESEDSSSILKSPSNENKSFPGPQLLGFRKIARPFSDSNFNRNDINDKNNFKDSLFYPIKAGFPSTISTEKTTTPPYQHYLELNSSQEGDDNTIHGFSTVSLPSSSNTNISSIIALKKNATNCSKGEILCGSGECIPEDYQCNMRRDCKDNSDELHCSCSEYLTVIGQSQKICDGVDDCWDLSDEQRCPWCSPGQFLCPQSRFCINMSQVCDGSNDCPFGTDEKHCVKLAKDEKSAIGIEYNSEGFLMVRKAGQWGKLCLDSLNDVALSESVKWKLDDLGKVVCTALTYSEMNETIQVSDEGNQQNATFYEITAQPLKSRIFNASECRSKDVVHVKCQSLECGLRPLAMSSSRRRIVGGQSTGSGSWPWQIALYKEGEFQCGAVLVSDTWLISAGHCFFSTLTAYWTARMGILRRGTELPSPSEHVRRLVQIILHPDYVDKGFINDIALLRLEKPVPFSDYLRPLCLPSVTEDVGLWHGQHCSVVGWGKLFEIGHIFPDSLQEVRLPVISTEECRKRIVFLSMYHITENMFCAGFERGGRDACLGDSGGPLMCQRQDGRWVLLGVTSNGDGCGRPGRPGVYTKVTKYLDWIHSVMRADSFNNASDDKCLGHRCPLGRCVLQHKVCDGRFDCANGSDESQCIL